MKKVMLIDNDRVLLEFMANVIENEGHQVLTAIDSINAIDLLSAYAPDVIIVDMVTPNIDGEMLCRLIRGMEGFEDVYLIVLYDMFAEEWIDIDKLEANACVAKEPVFEMVQKVLSIIEQPELLSA